MGRMGSLASFVQPLAVGGMLHFTCHHVVVLSPRNISDLGIVVLHRGWLPTINLPVSFVPVMPVLSERFGTGTPARGHGCQNQRPTRLQHCSLALQPCSAALLRRLAHYVNRLFQTLVGTIYEIGVGVNS
jgi:hypothetical protein